MKTTVKYIKRIMNISTILLVIGAMVFVYTRKHSDISFLNSDNNRLYTGWTYINSAGEEVPYEVTTIVHDINDGTIVTHNTLPIVRDEDYFAMYCTYMDYKLYIEDDIIYDSRIQNTLGNYYDSSKGSYLSFVKLPRNCSNKEFTLEVYSPNEAYQGIIGSVYVGDKISIICTLLLHHALEIVIAGLCLLLGGILLVLFIFNNLNKGNNLNRICSADFLIWAGIWILTESSFLQTFSSNAAFNMIFSYVAAEMTLRAFFLYTNRLLGFANRLFENLYTIMLCLAIIAFFILDATNTISYYESSTAFVVILIITCLFLLIQIIRYTFIKKKINSKLFMTAILLLCICAIIEVLRYSVLKNLYIGSILLPCIGLIAICFGINEINAAKKHIKMGYKAKRYEQLASTDSMTGCRNRAAYIEYMEHIQKKNIANCSEMSFLVCDVNNLKIINDQYGHTHGDQAIITCGSLLRQQFSDIGYTYRIGGDEFVVIISNASDEIIDQKITTLYQQVSEHNDHFSFPFYISIGLATVNTLIDRNLQDTFERADQKMYVMKKAMKKSMQSKL